MDHTTSWWEADGTRTYRGPQGGATFSTVPSKAVMTSRLLYFQGLKREYRDGYMPYVVIGNPDFLAGTPPIRRQDFLFTGVPDGDSGYASSGVVGASAAVTFTSFEGLAARLDNGYTCHNGNASTLRHGGAPVADQGRRREVVNRALERLYRRYRFAGFALGNVDPTSSASLDESGVATSRGTTISVRSSCAEVVSFGDKLGFALPDYDTLTSVGTSYLAGHPFYESDNMSEEEAVRAARKLRYTARLMKLPRSDTIHEPFRLGAQPYEEVLLADVRRHADALPSEATASDAAFRPLRDIANLTEYGLIEAAHAAFLYLARPDLADQHIVRSDGTAIAAVPSAWWLPFTYREGRVELVNLIGNGGVARGTDAEAQAAVEGNVWPGAVGGNPADVRNATNDAGVVVPEIATRFANGFARDQHFVIAAVIKNEGVNAATRAALMGIDTVRGGATVTVWVRTFIDIVRAHARAKWNAAAAAAGAAILRDVGRRDDTLDFAAVAVGALLLLCRNIVAVREEIHTGPGVAADANSIRASQQLANLADGIARAAFEWLANQYRLAAGGGADTENARAAANNVLTTLMTTAARFQAVIPPVDGDVSNAAMFANYAAVNAWVTGVAAARGAFDAARADTVRMDADWVALAVDSTYVAPGGNFHGNPFDFQAAAAGAAVPRVLVTSDNVATTHATWGPYATWLRFAATMHRMFRYYVGRVHARVALARAEVLLVTTKVFQQAQDGAYVPLAMTPWTDGAPGADPTFVGRQRVAAYLTATNMPEPARYALIPAATNEYAARSDNGRAPWYKTTMFVVVEPGSGMPGSEITITHVGS